MSTADPSHAAILPDAAPNGRRDGPRPAPPGPAALAPADTFPRRHIGPSDDEVRDMLALLDFDSLDHLTDAVVPADIRFAGELNVGLPRPDAADPGEFQLLRELRAIAAQNQVFRSYIGMGYSGTVMPPVIQRNILENPGWYTQYTPYQAEISQGRLEALLNFQTMVADLTALPLAGASLLDEATAAAEAMAMCLAAPGASDPRRRFLVADDCHPQTIAVVRSRAESLGVEVVLFSPTAPAAPAMPDFSQACGVLLQCPTTDGRIECYEALARRAHDAGALVVAATDLLALTLLRPPGEWGADIAVGSTQRFGVPLGYGGPHAAFIATRPDFARRMPGRIIGVSRDARGNTAYRMAIQTREQHIRREKATSNICTAQALLAIIAGMYAVYHGPAGLRAIARRIHLYTQCLRVALARLGHRVADDLVFDTLRVRPSAANGAAADAAQVRRQAEALGINFRYFDDGSVGVALDETISELDFADICTAFACGKPVAVDLADLLADAQPDYPRLFARSSPFLAHPVFNTHHSETELLRYITRLQSRDLSLAHSMIPLGSCTMKLNATSEMLPLSWPQFADIHPFAPPDQARGYSVLFSQLERWLAEITGFHAVSLQPNAGSQGEFAGLRAIRAFHAARSQAHRTVCLIPTSAHGTNPASAVVAGMSVVPVACDDRGNADVDDLRARAAEHARNLACLMVTYPSTHGVFEQRIREICDIVHEHGGQVYMDGANMNAQVGLCRPADIGADVCHLNLHKTFCIPHGGGGPGMGPIAVAAHLAPFLPGHPVIDPSRGERAGAIGPVAAAPWGSASILTISWLYIALMGGRGLTRATQVAILSANYMARRLAPHFPVLYTGAAGLCAHEFILDCRHFEKSAGVKVDDIAKRLMDYGFHAPTMSFPVPGTLMIEPTESESKPELDRFCDALISIRGEIRDIEHARADRADNLLRNAPHTIAAIASSTWDHPYSREQAAFPARWLREGKFWPPVARVDNPFGDRNLMCACPSVVECGN